MQPHEHLTRHFTLSEAMKSQIAVRLGIDNTPPDDIIPRLRVVSRKILEPVRVFYGVPIVPSSWYRCEPLEKKICWGGAAKSSFGRWCVKHHLPINEASWREYFARKQHPTGNAVDFEVPGIPNIEVARWIRENLKFDQLILEFWSPHDPTAGWVHASFTEDRRNRGEVLTMGNGGILNGLPKE